MPNLQKHFGESRICTPKPQLAMCTACLEGFNLSPVQIVIIKVHHMTQHTDAFPRETVQTFLVREEL
jgi:hypothetical protein